MAVLMFFSMLTGVQTPAVAEEETSKHYYIGTASEWVAAAGITEAGYWADTTVHITADIDFTGVTVPMFFNGNAFTGVIDGHGHTLSNLQMSTTGQYLGLVYNLNGKVKDLSVIDSTFTISNSYARGGVFAAMTGSAAVLYRCASDATVTATRGDHLGGLVGTCTSGVTVDNCIFSGTVSGGSGTASALLGYGGNQGRVYNSIALGTVSGGSTGMARMHGNIYSATTLMPLFNSYAVGMNALNYNGTPASYEVAGATVNGHDYNDATLQSVYTAQSVAEAAWKANVGYTDAGKGLTQVYYTLGTDGSLQFGNEQNKVVRVTVVSGGEKTYYYKVCGDTIALTVPADCQTYIRNAKLSGSTLTVGSKDATVVFGTAEECALWQARETLEGRIATYRQMNKGYFTDWTSMKAWLTAAETVAADEEATLAALQAQIDAEAALSKATVEFTYPDYPSIADYEIYRDIATITDYAIATKEDWLKAVAVSNTADASNPAENFSGKTLHVTGEIDFENEGMLPLCNGTYFSGTLNGHGYALKNIYMESAETYGPALVQRLYGRIEDLEIEGGTFKSTNSYAKAGAFAAFTGSGAVLYRCRSSATVQATVRGDHLGGLIGTCTSGVTLDQCIFTGTVTAATGAASALIGYGGNQARIYNSIALGTVSGSATGMARMHGNIYSATSLMPLFNSYAVGMNALNYNGTPASYEVAGATVNGHDYNDATLQSVYTAQSVAEAAWKANVGYTDAGKGNARSYYTIDADGNLQYGNEKNKVVRVTLADGSALYSAGDSTLTLSVPDGSVAVATGAAVSGDQLLLCGQDATVTFQTQEQNELYLAKQELSRLVGNYRNFNAAWFTDWSSMATWLATAETVAADADATLEEVQAQIDAEAALSKGTVTFTYPDYPSVSDYETYRDIASITDYAIATKEDWLKAVAISDQTDPLGAKENFSTKKLHLTADIDMEDTAMLPLCYGGAFDGYLLGHGYAIKNINITLDAPVGPVGLVAVMGGSRYIRDLSVESGNITVTGLMNGTATCKVGGILGRVSGPYSYLRKCSNAADISVENRDNVGGIVGDGRTLYYIDACFNTGSVTGNGILGYGAATTKVYNSFNAGNATAAFGYHPNVFNAGGYVNAEPLENCWSTGTLLALTGTPDETQTALRDELNTAGRVDSAREAAWKVAQSYATSGVGENTQVYFTLENGDVRFGTADTAIRRITYQCAGQPDRYAYAATGASVTLNYAPGVTAYALAEGTATLSGALLTLGGQDVAVEVTAGALPEGYIKVASYNIKTLSYNHSDPTSTSDQLAAVTEVLRAADADIVGLQEVDQYTSRSGSDVSQVQALAEALGYPYYRFTKTTDYRGGEYGHAILSRYPILSAEDYYFADAPGNIDGTEPRAFSRNVLNVDGQEVIFYNSHLANGTQAQLDYMSNFMEADFDAGRKVLMTADFNMWPWSFDGCYDTDKLTALNGGDDLNYFEETTTDSGVPIDNIIVSDNVDYFWDPARDSGVYITESTASDHSFLCAYLNLG